MHKAHLAIIEQTLELLPSAKLIVLPAYQNPFKKPCFLDAQTRFKELERALKGIDRVLLSDFEIKQERAVPTIESVLSFPKTLPPPNALFSYRGGLFKAPFFLGLTLKSF